MEKEVLVISIATVKSIKPVTWFNAQPIKPIRIPLCYPCIICFSVDYQFGDCFKKTKI